jgi:hypothetical protein
MAQGMERFPLAYVPNVSVPDVPVSYASKGASDQDYTLVSVSNPKPFLIFRT